VLKVGETPNRPEPGEVDVAAEGGEHTREVGGGGDPWADAVAEVLPGCRPAQVVVASSCPGRLGDDPQLPMRAPEPDERPRHDPFIEHVCAAVGAHGVEISDRRLEPANVRLPQRGGDVEPVGEFLRAAEDARERTDQDIGDPGTLERSQERVGIEGRKHVRPRGACPPPLPERPLHLPLGREEQVLAQALVVRRLGGDELERELETARLDHGEDRLDAGSHSSLFPAGDDGALPARALCQLCLGEAGAQARLADDRRASHDRSLRQKTHFDGTRLICYVSPFCVGEGEAVAGRRPGTRRRTSGKQGPAACGQLTLADWENERRREASEAVPPPPHPPEHTTASPDGVDRLADALAPRLAAELSARLHPSTGEPATTAALLTLDELVAQLPPAKQPQTWKRWLYERTRRGEIPGCVKLGGMLFFEREPALDWLRGGAASTR
jgi:hypothetical protein